MKVTKGKIEFLKRPYTYDDGPMIIDLAIADQS